MVCNFEPCELKLSNAKHETTIDIVVICKRKKVNKYNVRRWVEKTYKMLPT